MHICFLRLQTPVTQTFYIVIFVHTALFVCEETASFLFIYHNHAVHSENTSHVAFHSHFTPKRDDKLLDGWPSIVLFTCTNVAVIMTTTIPALALKNPFIAHGN